jgi:D-hexose-6-phosphate mutarotase
LFFRKFVPSQKVERAVTDEAKSVASRTQEVSKMQPPSVMMVSDIRRIVEQEQARMLNDPQSAQTIMAEPSSANNRVYINPWHQLAAIRNEYPDKQLKPVGKPKK